MNYTTLPRVKLALGSQEDAADELLNQLIVAASRAIDRYVTGSIEMNDYFLRADVSDEQGTGLVAADGTLHYAARKPLVQQVSALAWRDVPWQDWNTIDDDRITFGGGYTIRAYGPVSGQRVMVKISYNGGLATDTEQLPADIIEAATVLTVRYYREVKSGLGDTIGVAELGTLQYTKAWPVRVLDMLNPWRRVV